MLNKENEPKGNFLTVKNILKIMLLMSLFIVMVQNKGYENLILIFCLISFCLPAALVKWARNKYESFELSKVQQVMQHWYEANVTKQPNSTKSSVQLKTPIFEETKAELFNIPEPPPETFEPPYPTDEEIWGSFNNDESNNYEQH